VVVELCKSRSAVVALNGSHLLEEDLGALLGLGSTNPDNDKERYKTHSQAPPIDTYRPIYLHVDRSTGI
jgi:hypothetical protein